MDGSRLIVWKSAVAVVSTAGWAGSLGSVRLQDFRRAGTARAAEDGHQARVYNLPTAYCPGVQRRALHTGENSRYAGGNMAAPLLAEYLGGEAFMGFIAALAFATILAVVAGLTLAAASAMAHDLFVNVFKGGHADEKEQVKVAKISTVIFGACAIILGISFKGQNVAYMVGLTFAIACSGNFPALLLSIIWKKFTTQGSGLGNPRRIDLSHRVHRAQPYGVGRGSQEQGGHFPSPQSGHSFHDAGFCRRHRVFADGTAAMQPAV